MRLLVSTCSNSVIRMRSKSAMEVNATAANKLDSTTPKARNAKTIRVRSVNLRRIVIRQTVADPVHAMQQRLVERLVDGLAQGMQVCAHGIGVAHCLAP